MTTHTDQFTITARSLTPAEAIVLASNMERYIGEIANGTRKVGHLPMRGIAELIQFVRDSAANTPPASTRAGDEVENVAEDTYWAIADILEPHIERIHYESGTIINPGFLPASIHDSVQMLLEHRIATGPLKCFRCHGAADISGNIVECHKCAMAWPIEHYAEQAEMYGTPASDARAVAISVPVLPVDEDFEAHVNSMLNQTKSSSVKLTAPAQPEAVAFGRWAEGLPVGTRLMSHDGQPLTRYQRDDFCNVPLYTTPPKPGEDAVVALRESLKNAQAMLEEVMDLMLRNDFGTLMTVPKIKAVLNKLKEDFDNSPARGLLSDDYKTGYRESIDHAADRLDALATTQQAVEPKV